MAAEYREHGQDPKELVALVPKEWERYLKGYSRKVRRRLRRIFEPASLTKDYLEEVDITSARKRISSAIRLGDQVIIPEDVLIIDMVGLNDSIGPLRVKAPILGDFGFFRYRRGEFSIQWWGKTLWLSWREFSKLQQNSFSVILT